jgi:hypothetical protein
MINIVGSHEDPAKRKPGDKLNWLLTGEMAAKAGIERRQLIDMERSGKLPIPPRYLVGKVPHRLYPPEQQGAVIRAVRRENAKADTAKRRRS